MLRKVSRAESLTKRTLSRIPGSLEILWAAGDFARNRWAYSDWRRISGNPLPKLINEWRSDLLAVPTLNLPRKRILYVTGGASNIPEHSLAMSFVLAHWNCQVDVAWFEKILSHRDDDVYSRRKFQRYFGAVLNHPVSCDGLRVINLSSVKPAAVSAEMLKEAHAQAAVDVVYITRRETNDIHGAEKGFYEHRVQINADLMARLESLVGENEYDMLVTPNGAVLEYGAAYRWSRLAGLPAGTYEFWNGPGKAAASYGPNVLSLNTEQVWRRDAPHHLSPDRRERALALMRRRIATQNGGLTREQLNNRLALNPEAPILLICPNVPFDGMFLGEPLLFSSMRAWLVETARHIVSRHPAVNVVVRSHPDEVAWGTDETASSILMDAGPEIHDNIRVIPAKSDVSTYDLMASADLGIVYSSTTGLEMAVLGVPVVCGNHFHYNGKGFTNEPRTRTEYFETIDRILDAPAQHRLNPRQLEMALSYLDVYFNEYPNAFPWTFADFWQSQREWPLSRVISPEGDSFFGSFFNQLLGIDEAD